MSNFLIDPPISAGHLRQEPFHPHASPPTTATLVRREQQQRPGAVDLHPAHGLVSLLPSAGQVLHGYRRAPLVDAHCSDNAIRDFIRVTDENTFAEEMAPSGASAPGAMLVFGSPEMDGLGHA
jgi:hypothetical protein